MESVLKILGRRVPIWHFLAAILMLALTVSIGYTVERSDFLPLITQYLVLFVLSWACFQVVQSKNELPFFLSLGIVLRLALLFAFPMLSDDVYRFFWDGHIWKAGMNPFAELPSYYMQEGNEVPGLSREIYDRLNSPNYFTVYPPVSQAIFALAAWIAPGHLVGSVLVMKSVLFAFELGNLWLIPRLLQKLKLPARNVLIYALNPLVILEIMGNLHFEGVMVFFFLLAFYFLIQEKWWGAAPAWALSVATKLLPLMFLPFLIRRLSPWRLIGFATAFALVMSFLFLPLLSGGYLPQMGNSVDLYFRRFEFNGSLYYLVRGIGTWWVGYNPIRTVGPYLAGITLVGILALSLLSPARDWKSLPRQLLFAMSIYLLFATTVHPWYTILPLVFCLFTPFRYPVLWSALIFFTYFHYSRVPFSENLLIVALEYLILIGYAVYELIHFQGSGRMVRS